MDIRLPDLGKIQPEFFQKVIYPRLGAHSPDIVLGPQHGVDYGVIRVGDQVMAMSTDPFFIAPGLGWKRAAWFAFHIIVSDVAVSGLVPKFLTVDLNLPPEMSEETLLEIWETVHQEANKYGISIVTGHTARYAGCNYPMVGGATIIGIGADKQLRGPHLVKPGDRVLITKGAAVEAAGLLTATFPEYFRARGGAELETQAESLFYQMSVVDDAAAARRFEGVRQMHDATECGVWGGLVEMAHAGGYGLRIEQAKIPVQPAIRRVCEITQMDPYAAISEGTLLAMVSASDTPRLLERWSSLGILCAQIGEVVDASAGLTVIDEAGRSRELIHPIVDPFWKTFDDLFRAGEK